MRRFARLAVAGLLAIVVGGIARADVTEHASSEAIAHSLLELARKRAELARLEPEARETGMRERHVDPLVVVPCGAERSVNLVAELAKPRIRA